ncbi:MAG: 4Fe-4S dicluster domain-containing protein [Candidatus Gracilibacteria bacterium]|nr:4Fe-4S dicluster domain-containing protein [Candidatus Gracilibacteria bacterium]MDD4530574.1 4Fe-4S dicluster domain-containing protein [Candidatus Gracilibacteria bacterium]
MPVLINFKICDNSKDCCGISTCPYKAISWNNKKEEIEIDNPKCKSCGRCVKSCPVGAIKLAKTQEEFKKIQKEIELDPRKLSDLFVDRYGGEPKNEFFMETQDNFAKGILEVKNKPVVIELFNGDSIKCLIKSIPIKEIFEGKDIIYKKIEVENDILLEKYEIQYLPCLLFFDKGQLIGKIEGYYGVDEKEIFMKKVNEIMIKMK